MKIGLTGHSKGVGKHIYDNLIKDYEVFGFSRSNGFDIKDYDKILEKEEDLDVFINNAYFETYQSILFLEFFERWVYKPKIIININSSSIHQSGSWNPIYTSNKKHLMNVSQSMVDKYQNKKVKVINLNLGTIDTHRGFEEFNKIKGEKIPEIIRWCLDQPQEIEIQQLTIVPTTVKKSTFLF
jgi:short-subunit dehydrogenase